MVLGLKIRWCESTVSVRARPPVLRKFLQNLQKCSSQRKGPGIRAAAVNCNRTATGMRLVIANQDAIGHTPVCIHSHLYPPSQDVVVASHQLLSLAEPQGH